MKRGRLEVGELAQIDLGARTPRPGRYRYTLRLVHPVNPAPARPAGRAGPSRCRSL